jgi:hypothetical protein
MTDRTIGSGGDYSTLQAWEDASPANLVTDGNIWRGLMLSGTNLSASSTILTISGSTVDSTHYKELTTDTGASFADHASKLTNALKWNSGNGASISAGDNYGEAVVISEQYARLTKLQIQGNGGREALLINNGGNYVISQCIIEGQPDASHGVFTSTPTAGIVKNSLIVKRSANAGSICSVQGNVSMYNCTVAKPSGLAGSSVGLAFSYASGTTTLQNCAVFGASAVSSGSATTSYTTCRTDVASPPTGFTQIAYDTSTGSGFENITDATRDYRIKSTSAMLDVGTTDATNAATDIVGTARTSSTYDIGAWEYSAVVGGIKRGYPQMTGGFFDLTGGMS